MKGEYSCGEKERKKERESVCVCVKSMRPLLVSKPRVIATCEEKRSNNLLHVWESRAVGEAVGVVRVDPCPRIHVHEPRQIRDGRCCCPACFVES